MEASGNRCIRLKHASMEGQRSTSASCMILIRFIQPMQLRPIICMWIPTYDKIILDLNATKAARIYRTKIKHQECVLVLIGWTSHSLVPWLSRFLGVNNSRRRSLWVLNFTFYPSFPTAVFIQHPSKVGYNKYKGSMFLNKENRAAKCPEHASGCIIIILCILSLLTAIVIDCFCYDMLCTMMLKDPLW